MPLSKPGRSQAPLPHGVPVELGVPSRSGGWGTLWTMAWEEWEAGMTNCERGHPGGGDGTLDTRPTQCSDQLLPSPVRKPQLGLVGLGVQEELLSEIH